jgi:formylglycine-generating enzyme required for sulfatase activity
MKPIQTFLLATGLLAASSASAAITLSTVFVGDAGNANDTTGYGGVSYGYHIGTYEVTNSQYTAFLNATAATDTHSLYNANMGTSTHGGINRTGSSGSYTYSVKTGFDNKPVNYVSFWDAARFANWLTNGQGSGDTETGVYELTSAGISNNSITRNNTAFNNGGVAVASENEWYKAAYYDGSGGFTLYPTQSNSITTADANYANSVGTVTDVGTYSADPSYYGTFDQGGNVWEWNESIVGSSDRGLSGGSFGGSDSGLQSSGRFNSSPPFEGGSIGFRVSSLAPIPEPSAYAAILGCLGLGLALMRRKGRGTL